MSSEAPAFAHADFEKCPEHDHAVQTYAGLTKREYASIKIAAALTAALAGPDSELDADTIGQGAVQIADSVFAALAAM